MIPLKIIVKAVKKLLVNSLDAGKLDCLCILLTTIGQQLESQITAMVEQASATKGPATPGSFTSDPEFITTTFNKVKDFGNNKCLPRRLRTALLVSDKSTLLFNN